MANKVINLTEQDIHQMVTNALHRIYESLEDDVYANDTYTFENCQEDIMRHWDEREDNYDDSSNNDLVFVIPNEDGYYEIHGSLERWTEGEYHNNGYDEEPSYAEPNGELKYINIIKIIDTDVHQESIDLNYEIGMNEEIDNAVYDAIMDGSDWDRIEDESFDDNGDDIAYDMRHGDEY